MHDDDEMSPIQKGDGKEKVIMEEPDFKFVLYASFVSQTESVGIQLCKNLVAINKLAGLNNFELNLRFSKDEAGVRVKRNQRWDQTFIKDSLTRIAKVS